MRSFRTDDDAREARDLAIECMALLSVTGEAVRTHGSETHWHTYRRALADVMMRPGNAVNAAIAQAPALEPTHLAWNQITLDSLAQADLDAIAHAADGAALAPHVAHIRRRIDQLDALAFRRHAR